MSIPGHCALAVLKACGWRCVLVAPPAPKGILIVYPHTSNWDFIIGVLYRIVVGLPIRWLGKDTLFRWPLRRLLLRLGGVPVNRRERSGVVHKLLAEFAASEWMWLAMTPEGTRSHTDHWKSGFYRVAAGAGLPLGLAYIDYATRTVGVDTYMRLSGDQSRDLEYIRAFYAGKRGRRPADAGSIRLRE